MTSDKHFVGDPCKRCGNPIRYRSSRRCIACARDDARACSMRKAAKERLQRLVDDGEISPSRNIRRRAPPKEITTADGTKIKPDPIWAKMVENGLIPVTD